MTDAERIEQLEDRLAKMETNYQSVLRVLWHLRGNAKGEAGKIEKELEFAWQEYLNQREYPKL